MAVPGNFRLRGFHTIWPDINAALEEVFRAVERSLSWSWGPGFHVEDGEGGRTVSLALPPVVMVAKTGGSTIPAMSGSTPGSGAITLYHFNGTSLVSGAADTAKNLHPTEPVDADKWLKVIRIDGVWWVFWEPC
jgi:hypothetical protein